MSTTAELTRILETYESRPTYVVPVLPDASLEERPPVRLFVPPDAATAPHREGRVIPPLVPQEEEDAAAAQNEPEASTPEPQDAAPLVAPAPQVAGPPEQPPVRCGWTTCPQGEVCCNAACSICKPPGEGCDLLCGAPYLPISIPCGPNTCNITQVCCNRSCGICVDIGQTCSQTECENMYDPFSLPCGFSTCNVGQICCNPSCGICTAPGEPCNPTPCP